MTEIQILKTGGDDLVVLSRRDYNALMARAGDPGAEDAAAVRIISETDGHTALPGEVMDRIIDGESPLKVLMDHRGMTQAELAHASGLSQPFVSKMVRGKVGGGGETMKALARALAVSEDVLRLS
jgi:DNA-binding Xre family transcriptional regulator